MSKDGLEWGRAQTRIGPLAKWDNEGMKPNDVRYYRIFPINHGRFGQADNAGARAKKADIASPDQVLNLRQTGATTTSITMSWNSVPGAAKYSLSSAKVGDDGMVDAYTNVDDSLTTTTYTDDKDLIPGASRWYRVVALDDASPAVAVPGADGAEALGKTDEAGEPGKPVGLVAQNAFDTSLTDGSDQGVLLLWAKPCRTGNSCADADKDPTTSYTVQRMVDGGAWETLLEDTADLEVQTALSTHYHDEDELGSEERVYRVAALSGSGAGAWSNEASIPVADHEPVVPEAVGPATGVTTGPFNAGGAIQVNWGAAPNATGYIIYAVNVDELDDANGQIVVRAELTTGPPIRTTWMRLERLATPMTSTSSRRPRTWSHGLPPPTCNR